MSDFPRRGRQEPPSQGDPSYGSPPRPQQPQQWQPSREPAQQQWQQPQQQGGHWERQPDQRDPQPRTQQWERDGSSSWNEGAANQTADYAGSGRESSGYESSGYDPAGYESQGYEYEQTEPPALVPAPILRRAGARFIDGALVSAFGFALVLPITLAVTGAGGSSKKTANEGAIWNWPIFITLFAVMAVLPFLYEAVQLSMWGRTLGKRWLGIGVVRAQPLGEPLSGAHAVWRAAVNNIGYQIGVFFFLILAVKVWDYAFTGELLVAGGTLMAYLWAIWDEPLHQALHDRLAGTVVIDERAGYEDAGYDQGYDQGYGSSYESGQSGYGG
ncbi:RDD family protein [Actinomadura rupiterrae]|uniref:RDD family protein n=1 Tax=Actinomadura rupiterrae TaxID=559627 RepID=UPI0020A5E0D4|nr:RDD family protein [Actinomadura rupiterrae]MCP2342861.1 putative RDD family membrane protein YckC [Actinomadura rupiterrae]